MGGGVLQLIYLGKQDIHLTGNPQMSFFKQVYRRYTNFSIECIEQSFNTPIGVNETNTVAEIKNSGDLLKSLHLDVLFTGGASGLTGSGYTNWTNNTAHAFIKRADFEIGSNIVDTHYGHWLDVLNELTDHHENEYTILNKHARGDIKSYLNSGTGDTLPDLQMYIPFKFWFSRNPGVALPMLALKYSNVKLKLKTRSLKALINSDATGGAINYSTAPTCRLYGDFIFLDNAERKRFVSTYHEYLIEQVQHRKLTASTNVSINFEHPVKELIWTIQNTGVIEEKITQGNIDATQNELVGTTLTLNDKNDYFCYDSVSATNIKESLFGSLSYEGFTSMRIKLDGVEIFTPRKASYFGNLQPIQAGHKNPNYFIYCYSFSLHPEDYQPSGTCNFSKITSARMVFDAIQPNSNLNVYAINYNVLKISGGMAALGYTS